VTAAQSATATPRPARRRILFGALAAGALFAAAYSNSLRNGFHFDDIHVLEQNLFVRDLSNIPHFFTDARTFSSLPANAVYRPLVSTTLAIDYRIAGGLNPIPFHVTQLLLFAVLGAMLVAFYRRILNTTDATLPLDGIALVAAALFCVHTANTQTGNYISARSELLAALGVVGAFLVYLRWPGLRRTYVYLLPMVVGALAKNLAVTFAPLFLAYKLLFEEQLSFGDVFSRRAWPRTRAALLSCVPAFVVAAALFVGIERMSAAGQSYGGGTRTAYLATQAWVWVRYVGLFFFPIGLTADTDLKLFTAPDVRTIAGVCVLAASIAIAYWASRTRERRPIAFGILWFWIALGPTSSIFPLAEVTNDHRVFLPYIGLTLSVLWLAATTLLASGATAVRQRVFFAAASLVLLTHTLATYRRNRVWRDDETLWGDVARKSPNNGRGVMNYGISQMRVGRLTEARDLFLRAKALSPNYSYVDVNLGIVSAALGDQNAADSHFQRALAIEPDQPVVHRHFGYWLLKQGRGPEALLQLRTLVGLAPGDGEARDRLMQLYAALDDSSSLRALARETAALSPSDSIARAYVSGDVPMRPQTDDSNAWFLLGWSLTQSERHVEAAQAYRVAIARDSNNASAWNNLGWTLGKLGFYANAVHPLEMALRLQPRYQLARNNLAWVRDAARSRGS